MASAYPSYPAAAAPPAADPYAAYAQAAPQAAYPPGAYPAYTPPPVGYAPPPGAYAPPGGEDLRTVFVTGFPAEVKERELNNLLRFLPGYEASQLNWRGGQAQGFALFHHGQAARDAVTALHGLQFDTDVSLRCELARKNMYIKDDNASKRSRYEAPGAAPGTAPYAAPGAAAYGAAPAAAAAAPYYPTPRAAAYAPITNTRDNPPCNTLFIGNLSEGVNENELRALFSAQPGFAQIKMNRNSGSLTCFVEFTDLGSAMACHQGQQGAVLQSSDRGGIRIQYSKNPYGKKRDISGGFVANPYQSYGAPGVEQQPGAPGIDPSAPGVDPSLQQPGVPGGWGHSHCLHACWWPQIH